MPARKSPQRVITLHTQRKIDHATVVVARLANDETQALASRRECDDTMVFCLQPFGNLPDRGAMLLGVALYLQKQLVLQRRQSDAPRQLLAVAQKTPQLVAVIRERAVLLHGDRCVFGFHCAAPTLATLTRAFIAGADPIRHITKSHIDTAIRHLYHAVIYIYSAQSSPFGRNMETFQ